MYRAGDPTAPRPRPLTRRVDGHNRTRRRRREDLGPLLCQCHYQPTSQVVGGNKGHIPGFRRATDRLVHTPHKEVAARMLACACP